jgi:hypothetical protein
MTYAVGGRQYVVTVDGGHGAFGTRLGDYVWAYAWQTIPDLCLAGLGIWRPRSFANTGRRNDFAMIGRRRSERHPANGTIGRAEL